MVEAIQGSLFAKTKTKNSLRRSGKFDAHVYYSVIIDWIETCAAVHRTSVMHLPGGARTNILDRGIANQMSACNIRDWNSILHHQ
jgi:hypothetical protein